VLMGKLPEAGGPWTQQEICISDVLVTLILWVGIY
jgi:hypothetical protein